MQEDKIKEKETAPEKESKEDSKNKVEELGLDCRPTTVTSFF